MNKLKSILRSTCTTVAYTLAVLGVFAFGAGVSAFGYHTAVWSVQGYVYPYTTPPYWGIMPEEFTLFDVTHTPWVITLILVILLVCIAALAISGFAGVMQCVLGDGVKYKPFDHEQYIKSIRDARRVRLEERFNDSSLVQPARSSAHERARSCGHFHTEIFRLRV